MNNEPSALTEPYTTVTETTKNWTDGWYVSSDSVEITDSITVTGDVKLILSDGAQLNTKNICVNQGNTFSIYCQSAGTGSLTAKSSSNVSPGIGAGRYQSGGIINIYGGIIYAQGGKEGAGIGGSASCSYGGSVNIYGGTVTAVGGYTDGAGIGGGWDQSYTNGPYGGNGADVCIYGGNVTAIGGGSAPSIGAGGSSHSHGSFSTGENGNAVISANTIMDQSQKSQWSGIFLNGNNGTVYGNPTLTEDLTIDSSITLNIPENSSLTISEDVNLTNNGTIISTGNFVNNGILTNNGTISYKVTSKLTNFAHIADCYVTQGMDYTATLTAAQGCVLPQSITVTVGGTALTAGENTYFYDSATGKLTINKAAITGVVTITATAPEVINKVNITIALPQGGHPLSTDAACETAGINSVMLYWTDTENNPVSGNANYYPWCYKAHMIITPMEGYILTDSTIVSVNSGGVEEQMLDTDGTLKVANPYDSNQVKLISITQPEDIMGVANGTEKTAAALGLPSTVTIATEAASIRSAGVVWDLDNLISGSYDPAKLTEQTFRVKGTVSLPDEVNNPDNISLEITIDITVAAHSCTAIGDWQYDSDSHWKTCSCGTKIDEEAHSGGTAICTKQAVCSVCGCMYGEPLGHDWEVSYEWGEDGKSCTAIRTCKIDASHKETANATVNGKKAKAATCTEKGETTYTATFAESWASKQTKTVADIPATGHSQLTSSQTGDNSNMQLWIAVLLASGVGLTISVMVNKKRRCVK